VGPWLKILKCNGDIVTKESKNKFELYAVPARKFWDEYKKTKFKFHDEDGEFGYEGYSYYVFQSKDDRCVLIGTKERIWSLRQRKKLAEIFKKYNIDLSEVLEDGKVIIAVEKKYG
jgi:hypothetical protein